MASSANKRKRVQTTIMDEREQAQTQIQAHAKYEERGRKEEGDRYDRVRLGMGTNG